MAVSLDVSRQHLRDEISLVQDLASSYGWEVAPDFDSLTVVVRMRAHTGDLFIVEVRCDNYKEMPPFIEFIDPDSGEKGTRHAYPRSSDSFFHDSGPCICAPFNRKAYKAVVPGAPHGDWSPAGWMTSRANGRDWSNYSKLGDMLGQIQIRLSSAERYKGRMA